MDMAVAADDNATMRRLYVQQDWPRLALAAERRAQQQPQDSEAWCLWGISELMQLKGGPDKLLRASLLGNAEAGLVAAPFGVKASVISGGVLCVIGVLVCGILLPKFLRYNALTFATERQNS